MWTGLDEAEIIKHKNYTFVLKELAQKVFISRIYIKLLISLDVLRRNLICKQRKSFDKFEKDGSHDV